MNRFVTVLTFENAINAQIAKLSLEAEGITCFLKDEISVQVIQYSEALGGVKLQVHESDLEKAIKILERDGYSLERESEDKWAKIDKLTKGIPFLNTISVQPRAFILFAMFVTIGLLIILGPVAYKSHQAQWVFSEGTWCFDYLKYRDKNYKPETYGLVLRLNGNCDETVHFHERGSVHFPGFKSKSFFADWVFFKDSVLISQADTFGHIFNGSYSAEYNSGKLTLKSSTTEIHLRMYSQPSILY